MIGTIGAEQVSCKDPKWLDLGLSPPVRDRPVGVRVCEHQRKGAFLFSLSLILPCFPRHIEQVKVGHGKVIITHIY
jgi:hypothetical protein